MILRILTLTAGVTGAAGLSQYPEFSQQYIQRMAGQIDALTQVVNDFDASALRSGLTRTQALEQMTGTQFLDDRRADMSRAFLRLENLADNYAHLQLASPMERILMPHRMADSETFAGTWSDYKPALPPTLAGAISAALGFIAGWGILSLILTPLRRIFRKTNIEQDQHV
jgi:hypothetical protein